MMVGRALFLTDAATSNVPMTDLTMRTAGLGADSRPDPLRLSSSRQSQSATLSVPLVRDNTKPVAVW